MNQQAAAIIVAGAIIIAGVLIATAIALTNHWSFIAPGGVLLNRWTGTVVLCAQSPATLEVSCPGSKTPPQAP
jgi:uncharacterized membrane protein YgdD (TMEM256/DUF423 family)